MGKKYVNLIHKELSYNIRGAAMEVRNIYGPGHKEKLYQNALAEELKMKKIKYEKEPSIRIYSPKTGKMIGSYQPDFLVADKIIVETKAQERIPKRYIDQLYDYLRNSEYELGFFINFGGDRLEIKRIIYTNNRKQYPKLNRYQNKTSVRA